eukprot:scaffold7593_cov78-Phaeocystis_antarctica.AAC.1
MAKDASAATGVVNTRAAEGRSAAVSYTSLRAAASSAARVARRCIFPEVVLGMVFSLTATTPRRKSRAAHRRCPRCAAHGSGTLLGSSTDLKDDDQLFGAALVHREGRDAAWPHLGACVGDGELH